MALPPTFVEGFHDKDEVLRMKYNDFGYNGMKVSSLALGTAGFCHLYGEHSLENCKATVLAALKAGINYIDTAPWYGQGESEDVLGECLKDIPRKAYYLATKVGRYELDVKKMFDFSAEKTKASFLLSLNKLNAEYVDVIQIHDIEFSPTPEIVLNETIPVLQQFVSEGKAKVLGITGYSVSALQECISRSTIKIDMILSYARLTLMDDTLAKKIDFFETNNITVVNAATLAMGILTSGGPQSWHPASKNMKEICKEASDYCKLKNVSLAKLAIDFGFQQIKGVIKTQLVGVNNVELLASNLDVFYNGLEDREKEVKAHIMTHIFSKLTEHDWEGIEIQNFRKQIEELQ